MSYSVSRGDRVRSEYDGGLDCVVGEGWTCSADLGFAGVRQASMVGRTREKYKLEYYDFIIWSFIARKLPDLAILFASHCR